MDWVDLSRPPKIVIIIHSKAKPQITKKKCDAQLVLHHLMSWFSLSTPFRLGYYCHRPNTSWSGNRCSLRPPQHQICTHWTDFRVSHLLPSLYPSNLIFHYSLKASIVWGQPGSLQSPECDLLLSAVRPLRILFLLPGITSHYLTNPKCSFPFKKLINWQISFLLYYIMLLNVEEISVPKVTVWKAQKGHQYKVGKNTILHIYIHIHTLISIHISICLLTYFRILLNEYVRNGQNWMAGDRADRETAHCQLLYFWFLYTMNVWLIQKINGYFKNVNKPWHTLNQLGNTIKTPNVDFFPSIFRYTIQWGNVPSSIVGTEENSSDVHSFVPLICQESCRHW